MLITKRPFEIIKVSRAFAPFLANTFNLSRSALLSGGIGDAFIFADEASTPPIYRVRIGPLAGVDDYDALVMKLEGLGITDPYLVTL